MQEERYGFRNVAYSFWHRSKSIQRYMSIEQAQTLSMIDSDGQCYIEYDEHTRDVLILVEVAIDKGHDRKAFTVTQNLAKRVANPPCLAYLVFYKESTYPNPAEPTTGIRDIESFRVKRIHPIEENALRTLTPQEWANELIQARKEVAEWFGRGFELKRATNHCHHSQGYIYDSVRHLNVCKLGCGHEVR